MLADLDGPKNVKIGYAAPGAHSIWTTPADHEPDRALVELLGLRRAQILTSLRTRATTTMLATQLQLAPATISAHLSVLTRIGLTDRIRVGSSVYYQHSERGNALVDLFEQTAP